MTIAELEKFEENYYAVPERREELIFPVRGKNLESLMKLARWALEKEAQIDRFCRCHLSANDENIMCESCDILADFPGGANE